MVRRQSSILPVVIRVALLFLLVLPATLRAAELRELRVEPGDSRTRVVLELSGAAEHRFFLLDGPRRAVIDLRGSRLATAATVPAGRGLATRIRTGPQPNGDLRVVVGRTFAFSELPDAHAYVSTGRKRGNAIVHVSAP